MGFLQSLLGSPTPPNEEEKESTIDLPEDEYTVAYPAAVRRGQLDAFSTVIAAERDAPYLEGPGADFLLDAMDETWQEHMPGDDTWQEGMAATREEAEAVIAAWDDQFAADLETDVVFLPVGVLFRLEGFLTQCEGRADNPEDPFTLPDEFLDAVLLIKQLRKAKEEKEPVLVHVDQVPDTEDDG